MIIKELVNLLMKLQILKFCMMKHQENIDNLKLNIMNKKNLLKKKDYI